MHPQSHMNHYADARLVTSALSTNHNHTHSCPQNSFNFKTASVIHGLKNSKNFATLSPWWSLYVPRAEKRPHWQPPACLEVCSKAQPHAHLKLMISHRCPRNLHRNCRCSSKVQLLPETQRGWFPVIPPRLSRRYKM